MNESSISEARRKASQEKDVKRAEDVAFALKLKSMGYSNVAIGDAMGLKESSVRSLLRQGM